MARKKQNKPVAVDIDLSSLADDAGLTLLRDSDYALVKDRLPTFLPRVDKVFGGGLPFGRMIEVAGKPGGGKCLVKSTNILTPDGYKTVEEIINEQGLEASCTSKQVPAEVKLINRHGEVEKTSYIHFNNKQDVYRVVTRTGLEQKITGNHPLLVIDSTGTHVWKRALDLRVGDYLVTRRGDMISGDTKLDSNYAYVLGALVADGCFEETKLSFTNNDEAIISKVREFLKDKFGKVVEYVKDNSTDLRVHSKEEVTKFYKEIGVQHGVAKDKRVPSIVLGADIVSQVSFIRGFIDCEGYLSENRVEVSSASKTLITQIQLMLKNIGIIGFLRKKTVKGYEQNYYGVLTLYGEDAVKYVNTIGFDTPDRQKQISKFTEHKDSETKKGHSNSDKLPFSASLLESFYNSVDPQDRNSEYYRMIRPSRNKQVSRDNVNKIITDLEGDPFLQHHLLYINDHSFYYDEVTSIEHAGEEPTFDFTLPETHSFIAESIVNHNSTLAFHVSRVATSLGCIVVLIDVEGTADRERLAHLGIDVSKILVKQPDPSSGISLTVEEIGRTVEQCLELFTKKYPGVPVVFVWDSVGITPSQDELDKDFGDKNVGSRAKAITQFVTKVAPMITEAKAMLIGINQVRDDIGGNPMFAVDKVPGGKAWEHYASLRLVVRASKPIKKGTDKIGHNLVIKVNKSKVSRPFQEAQAFLISDNGLDYEYNVAKMAEEEGVLLVKGHSYEYVDRNGELHKMKKDNFIEWLRTPEGQHVREEILSKLVELEYPEGTYPVFNNETLDISGWIDKVTPQEAVATSDEVSTDSSDAEDLIADVQDEITGEIG